MGLKKQISESFQCLSAETRHFRSMPVGPLRLVYDPSLDAFETDMFCVACAEQIVAIERLLRTRLRPWQPWRPRPCIYLFESKADVSRILGAPAAGFAHRSPVCIVVNLTSDWREILRHELAHIIGYRWNPQASCRLLIEGLAVWAQRTWNGKSIDVCAMRASCRLDNVLAFLCEPIPESGSIDCPRYYCLAGSLVKSLIRRCGLHRFRRLYRASSIASATPDKQFKRRLGISLSQAVEDWLSELHGEDSRPACDCGFGAGERRFR